MQSILFSGREIVAHRHQGTSPYLLVTFIGAYHEHEASAEFLFKDFVVANHVNCIGITTHVRGYYVSEEMPEVLALVREQAGGFGTVIVTGQSMGGYAAIKYSRALGATHVVGFAPGFSIDPADLDLPSETHRKILERSLAVHKVVPNPAYKAMGIRPEDCAGLLVTVHDPDEAVDDYNVMMIRRQQPDTCVVRMFSLGHVTARLFTEHRSLHAIFDAVQTGDGAQIQAAFRFVSRNSPYSTSILLARVARAKPRLCLRLLGSPRLATETMRAALGARGVHTLLAYALLTAGEPALAHAHLAQTFPDVFKPLPGAAAPPGPEALLGASAHALLLSSHGTFLGYHVSQQRLRAEAAVFGRKDVVPVLAAVRDGAVRLHFLSGQRRVDVDVAPGPAGPLVVVPLDRNRIALRRGDRYLRTTDAGEVDMQAEAASLWEELVPVPLAADSPLLTTSSVGWFEQALINETVAAEPPAPAGKRGPRWLRLFS